MLNIRLYLNEQVIVLPKGDLLISNLSLQDFAVAFGVGNVPCRSPSLEAVVKMAETIFTGSSGFSRVPETH